MKKTLLTVILLTASAAAIAGKPVYGYSKDKEVAVREANLNAQKGALARGTCMSEWANPDRCTQDQQGGWSCSAVYANHKGSCKSNKTVAADVEEASRALEAASKAAAAAAAVAGSGGQ